MARWETSNKNRALTSFLKLLRTLSVAVAGRVMSRFPRLACIAGHEIAERHRIAQAIDRRDAVLPFPSRPAAQQIGRAGADPARGALPPLGLPAAGPQGAGRPEGDPDGILRPR